MLFCTLLKQAANGVIYRTAFRPIQRSTGFYRRARISGLWDRILQHMVIKTRENAGRKAEPSYGIIGSQSVKTVAASEKRGIDGGKNERTKAAHCCRRDGKSTCSRRPCGEHS